MTISEAIANIKVLSHRECDALAVVNKWAPETIFDENENPTKAAVARLAATLAVKDVEARLLLRFLFTMRLLTPVGVDADEIGALAETGQFWTTRPDAVVAYPAGTDLRQIIHRGLEAHKDLRDALVSTYPDERQWIPKAEYLACLKPLADALVAAADYVNPFLQLDGKAFVISGILADVKKRRPTPRAIDVSAQQIAEGLEELEAMYDRCMEETEVT